MAATPIYGIDYPLNTDLVTNGAAQMQLLAGDAETAIQNQTAAMLTGTRNRIFNPTFTQAQITQPAARVADFWQYATDNVVGMTNTRNTLGVTAGLPEWVSGSMTQAVASNAAGVARFVRLQQLIHDIRSLSLATLVVSFYAKAAAATPKVGVNLVYAYGTGGAPSLDVDGTGQAVTISTTWTRYSVTFSVPTVSGKTLGTNGDDGIRVQLWTSAGSNYNTQTGSIGLQTSTIDITGVQVERNFLTPLEVRSIDSNFAESSNFSAWETFTPTIQQGASPMATTVTNARYLVLGKTCWFYADLLAGAAGTAGQTVLVNGTGLPVPRVNSIVTGTALMKFGAGTFNVAIANLNTTGPAWNFYIQGGAAGITTTLASGDLIRFSGYYDIA